MRSPRRRFAATFVITLAALPACGRTVDHRDPVGPTQPATTDTNPRDHRGAAQSWAVAANPDGSCTAQGDNGGAPVKIACPAGASDGGLRITRETDGCYLMEPEPACPEGASCNPPPPQKVDCPPQ
jgi:hypothetical protein